MVRWVLLGSLFALLIAAAVLTMVSVEVAPAAWVLAAAAFGAFTGAHLDRPPRRRDKGEEGHVREEQERPVRDDADGVAEELRVVLIVLAGVTLVIAIVLTFTNHDTSDAWSAFGAAFGLLAGQHLDKPKQRLLRTKTAP